MRLLVTIILLWTAGAALLTDVWAIGVILLVLGVGALALCIWHSRRQEWGSVAAWAACSLVPLAFLALVALAHVHLHEFTGSGPDCDPSAQACGPQPLQGLLHTLPLVIVLAVGFLTLRLIARARRQATSAAP